MILPAKTVSVECIHVVWVSLLRIFTSGQKRNMLISPPIFTLFQNFFLNERSHLYYYLDVKISGNIVNLKVYCNLKVVKEIILEESTAKDT